ncbi:MAG: HD domain-containing protein [Ginsengibacter sp.]
MDKLPLLQDHIIAKLEKGLSRELTYHCLEHTLDVLKQSENIAHAENIKDEEKLYLLKVAALYHDSGFLFVYRGHEEAGCKLAAEELPLYGFEKKQIDTICGLIMATKIPQSPKNHLEQVICDADLDYLGRNDYLVISNHLYHEFLLEGFVKNDKDWLEMQISFFKIHHYFTAWSVKHRGPVKQQHFEKLLEARK